MGHTDTHTDTRTDKPVYILPCLRREVKIIVYIYLVKIDLKVNYTQRAGAAGAVLGAFAGLPGGADVLLYK